MIGTLSSLPVSAQPNLSAPNVASFLADSTPIPRDQLPPFGTYWLASGLIGQPSPPYPFPPYTNAPVYGVGNGEFVVDDTAINSSTALQAQGMAQAADLGPPLPGGGGSGGGGDTNAYVIYTFPTNGLWLQITNVANGLAYANLNNATDSVYAILSKADLILPTWTIEQEVWPTNPAVMPFQVPEEGRTNLFLWAMDWTGVTENGNTTPDWWYFQYFGTSVFLNGNGSLTLSDTNLDSQGRTMLSDYRQGLDPNVINFALVMTNNYVRTSSFSVGLNVDQGTPSYYAILLDNTNLGTAPWIPYTSSNLTVNLGSNAGAHKVRIGLRGLPESAQQTWQGAHVYLEQTPPVLTITNPATTSVYLPVAQVQGYSLTPLASASYDISNATGMATNLPVAFTDEYYDTNAAAFTTNGFQLYDVSLTTGLNTITLHALDLAGNATTTNFSLALDYSGATNAPVFTLYWPRNGDQVSGTNFTLRGWIDNPTAQVQAWIVDASGNTNAATGIVERNGLVWAQNLPLSAGTNHVTLTATDAVGNSVTTDFNVIQSTVVLTVSPLDTNSLYESTFTVTGAISDVADYTVWVNGTAASVDGSGNWTANNVSLNPGGTALVQTRAIPNSDNAGNGSGGGGVPGDSSLGNPDSPNAVTLELDEPRGSAVIVGTYNLSADGPYTLHGDADWTVDTTFLWDNFGPDSFLTAIVSIPDVTNLTATESWPDPKNPTNAPPQVVAEHSDIDAPIYTQIYTVTNSHWGDLPWTRNGESTFKLITGSSGTSPELFVVNVSVTIITNVYWTPASPGPVPGYPAPNSMITANGQTPDTNGNAYLVLPPDSTNDLTVKAAGQPFYIKGASADHGHVLQCATLNCSAAGSSRTTIGIGENAYCYVSGGLSVSWSVSGGGSLSQTNGAGTILTAPLNPGSCTVTATVGGTTVPQPLTFTVVAPSGVSVISASNPAPGAQDTNGTVMGAQTSYTVVISPSNVSFKSAQFRESLPALTNTWPNGSNLVVNPQGATKGFPAPACGETITDTIGAYGEPVSYLLNGTNYVNFSYTYTWYCQYLNSSNSWVTFANVTALYEYRASDKQCRVTYLGMPGSWQGPYSP